ncbi:MAG: hypothetical protein ABI780_13375, partial [Ardenticatenales bacterium]
ACASAPANGSLAHDVGEGQAARPRRGQGEGQPTAPLDTHPQAVLPSPAIHRKEAHAMILSQPLGTSPEARVRLDNV